MIESKSKIQGRVQVGILDLAHSKDIKINSKAVYGLIFSTTIALNIDEM